MKKLINEIPIYICNLNAISHHCTSPLMLQVCVTFVCILKRGKQIWVAAVDAQSWH